MNRVERLGFFNFCQFVPWQAVVYISIFPANTTLTEKDTTAGGI